MPLMSKIDRPIGESRESRSNMVREFSYCSKQGRERMQKVGRLMGGHGLYRGQQEPLDPHL